MRVCNREVVRLGVTEMGISEFPLRGNLAKGPLG